jgi:hypothetical protein
MAQAIHQTAMGRFMAMAATDNRFAFTALPGWIIGKATAMESLLLLVLQSHYPNIRPSLATLAKESGVARSTVCSTLAELERKGWITRGQEQGERGRNRATRYELHIWDPRWLTGLGSPNIGLVRESDQAQEACGGGRVVRESDGGSPGIGHELNQENKNKLKPLEPPLPPAAQGALRPPAVAAHPCRDRDGFLIADPEPQPAAAAEPPVVAEPPGQPQPQAAAGPPLQAPAAVQPQPQQQNPPRPLPDPADPEATPPVKPKARKREAGFVPTVEDVPAALLPVQRELLAFWGSKGGKRTERAWAAQLGQLRQIQDDPAGGTDAARSQLEAGSQAAVFGKAWMAVTYANWKRFGPRAVTPIAGTGFPGRRSTMDRVMGAMALIEQRDRSAAARQAEHGALAVAEVA